jgi:hypothetical protein
MTAAAGSSDWSRFLAWDLRVRSPLFRKCLIAPGRIFRDENNAMSVVKSNRGADRAFAFNRAVLMGRNMLWSNNISRMSGTEPTLRRLSVGGTTTGSRA